MKARAESTKEHWFNYLTFKSDAAAQRDAALARIDQQRRFGSLAPAQADAAAKAIEDDYQTQLQSIEAGPTRELLNAEFEAQRSFAEEEFNRTRPTPAGPTQTVVAGGQTYGGARRQVLRSSGDIGDQETWVDREGNPITGEIGSMTPEPTPQGAGPSFTFASTPDEYFGSMFGTESTPSQTSSTPGAPRAKQRLRGGAGASTSGIGVGQVYSWY